ncbi:SDR family oxidoreductase [Streptomyces sp. HC44]|uniref:SDR family oxidoreductase n=1 Tax=Streptomyces scabichelini TaxID=2711217 RepID=A0A6G4VDF9_9ACTN|nr:SDR family NAD(P)-dependent oxidoreductase [Streptomyces scabichelini]NGO12129.1 SDR family oxidoreductase [Streptomyces scabichelini]
MDDVDDREDLFSPDLFSLAGRTALVTGGSSGIGASAARALRAMGAKVAVTSRDSGRARSAAERLAKQRVPARGTNTAGEPEVMGLSCEVTDEREVDAAVAAVMERWGRLDVLVTSAGRLARGSVTDLPTEDLHGCFATNVFGTWYACRAAARVMTGAGFGRIITLGSVLGSVGAPQRGAYAASKGAVVQLTKSLALELADSGVTANCLLPGPVLTEMNEGARDDPVAAAFVRQEVPLGRWGEAHELSAALLLLASPHSAYLTGAVLPVDGGYLAH